MKLKGAGQPRTGGFDGSRLWTGGGVQRMISYRDQRDHSARHQAAREDD